MKADLAQAIADLHALRMGTGADTRALAAELAWLRWFYANADFGPAHDDVLFYMRREYKQAGGTLPAGYEDDEG